MRSLVFIALLSLAAAKPRPGGLWGAPSLSYVHQPAVAVAQPVVHAAPAAATSYASFQQVIHPVAQPVVHAAPIYSQPIVHAPVVSQPIVHAPVVSQPIVQAVAQPVVHSPVVQSYSQPLISSVGHTW